MACTKYVQYTCRHITYYNSSTTNTILLLMVTNCYTNTEQIMYVTYSDLGVYLLVTFRTFYFE